MRALQCVASREDALIMFLQLILISYRSPETKHNHTHVIQWIPLICSSQVVKSRMMFCSAMRSSVRWRSVTSPRPQQRSRWKEHGGEPARRHFIMTFINNSLTHIKYRRTDKQLLLIWMDSRPTSLYSLGHLQITFVD